MKSKTVKLDSGMEAALVAAFTKEPLTFGELQPLIVFAKGKLDFWNQVHAKLQVMSITVRPTPFAVNIDLGKKKTKAAKRRGKT